MLPIVTILGLDIALALGGAIFTETIFGLPGLGKRRDRRLRAARPAGDRRRGRVLRRS